MNASANLLVLPSKFTLAVLAPKVVPRGSRGVSRRLQGSSLGGFGAPLGSLGPHLGSFSDGFEIILGSFGDLFGSFGDLFEIFWGSSGSHFFDFSEFGSRAQTPIIRTPWG